MTEDVARLEAALTQKQKDDRRSLELKCLLAKHDLTKSVLEQASCHFSVWLVVACERGGPASLRGLWRVSGTQLLNSIVLHLPLCLRVSGRCVGLGAQQASGEAPADKEAAQGGLPTAWTPDGRATQKGTPPCSNLSHTPSCVYRCHCWGCVDRFMLVPSLAFPPLPPLPPLPLLSPLPSRGGIFPMSQTSSRTLPPSTVLPSNKIQSRPTTLPTAIGR